MQNPMQNDTQNHTQNFTDRPAQNRHVTIATDEIAQVTVVANSSDRLVGIYYPEHWTHPDVSAFGPSVDESTDPFLAEAARQLRQYLAGDRTEFELPIELSGTDFQQRVWAMLQQVSYGETTTYGELAARLGDRGLARMVGQAVGHNPVSIVIGCHRVLGSTGSLTGYAGGLERKEFLLALEGSKLPAVRLF